MRDRGFPGHLVSWYESFVTNRVANSELLGSKLKRRLHLGTPQGGVLSPICWNIPFDELLVLLNEDSAITATGFADDLAPFIKGIDPCSPVDQYLHTKPPAVGASIMECTVLGGIHRVRICSQV